jgi:hypothetical protein
MGGVAEAAAVHMYISSGRCPGLPLTEREDMNIRRSTRHVAANLPGCGHVAGSTQGCP